MVRKEISQNLEENITYIEGRIENCSDIVHRHFFIGEGKYEIYMMYMDSMVDRALVEGDILKALIYGVSKLPQTRQLEAIKDYYLTTADAMLIDDMDIALTHAMSGNTMIFGQGCNYALLINSKRFPIRGVTEAKNEASVRGPKDSFTESVRFNTVLIRRRIRDTRLKAIAMQLGVRTKTDVAVMYMEDLIYPEMLLAVQRKLSSFVVDGIFDTGMLEQFVESAWYTPFPQMQTTERPDKAASALLEGRIALIVDNSPTVLLLPVTLNCFFQASDDYYNRWEIVFFIRILRYIAAIVAILLPGVYIALASFHTEVFPVSLALSFTAARLGVPLTVATEVIMMEIAFEILREAGIRLPGPMGSTLGIVGGLIIGQAAVEANIVSPIVVIVVALTALASFTIPNESFASAFRIVKYFLILMSALFGVSGLGIGCIAVLIHLCSLESFGIPYLMPFVDSSVVSWEDHKDSILRFPLFTMRERPIFTKREARKRMFYKDRRR